MKPDHADTLRLDIDRLVAGDWPDADTEQLVERFDASPDGWKRCALAFMEAQSWQRTFQSLMPETPPASAKTSDKPAPRRRRGRLMAVVAVCALAIGAGMAIAWERFHAAPARSEEITGNKQDSQQPAPQRGEPQPKSNAKNPRIVGLIRVSSNGVTESAFSLVNNSKPELAPVALGPKSLSDYDRELWVRRGFRIEQHRKIVSVVLADGSRFRFPVEWTDYRYVGQPIF